MKSLICVYIIFSFENCLAQEYKIHSAAVDSGQAKGQYAEAFKNQKCTGQKCEVIFTPIDEEELKEMRKEMKKKNKLLKKNSSKK